MNESLTIGRYLIEQLSRLGARHVFGVTGDYVLGLYHELEQSPLQIINTCDEQGAGFAADAYARIHGLGVVCITYCVGGLKVANTTAQAYAEKSPVVVISGAPGTRERVKNPLLHHKVRDFDTQLKVFEQFTIASAVLDNPETACRDIDRVLRAAVRYKRPVYLEVPRDMVAARSGPSHVAMELESRETSEPQALDEALQEAKAMIDAAERPVLLAGVELHRFGLQERLVELVEKTGLPVASTLLSKSVISELHPRYLGVYGGAMGREEVRRYVESSDCLVLLGAFLSDINLGVFTAQLDQGRSVSVTSERASIRYHGYEGIQLRDFLQGLIDAGIRYRAERIPTLPVAPPVAPEPGKPVTIDRLFRHLNAFLDEHTVVIADPGDALFGATDLVIHRMSEFLSPAYYTSLGFAVPASLGAQLARPDLRPIVLVGDGAFQMTGMELATAVRFGLSPIVLVLNNGGYGTERPLQDGRFNDVQPWRYSRIPDVVGGGLGFAVETEDQLDDALKQARARTDTFCILDVKLSRDDRSPALQRFTKTLKKHV